MRGIQPEEFKKLLLSVGSHRDKRPFTPLEVARCFRKAINAGSSLKDCANAVHFDGTSMISRFLRLLDLDPQIHHYIDWGRSGTTIAFTAASELVRLQRNEQSAACLAVLKNNLSTSEVKQLVQLSLRSKKTIELCISEVLRLRPQVTRTHLIIGSVKSKALRERIELFTQAQRDELLCSVLSNLFPSISGYSSRLGSHSFTISGDDDIAATLSKETDFEEIINDALQKKVLLA